MSAVALVTDSTAALDAMAPAAAWTVVPLELEIDGARYREGAEMSAADFLRVLQEVNSPPETLPPPVAAFAAAYAPLVAGGARVLSIHLSGELSRTVEHAREAAREWGDRVAVVDSRLAGAALGLYCLEVEARLAAGETVDGALAAARATGDAALVAFSPYTLDFLYLGGRLARAPRPAGSGAADRPILAMRGGRLELVERVEGETTRVERIAELVEERFGRDEPLVGAVSHAGARGEEAARRLEERILAARAGSVRRRAPLGPVLCAHAGFDVCGIAVYPRALSALGG